MAELVQADDDGEDDQKERDVADDLKDLHGGLLKG
jgi:hypothetical protein